MYIPFSLGITTALSLVALLVGQVITLLKLNNLSKTQFCSMAGVGAAGVATVAASKAGYIKAGWEFIKLTFGKIKDKFKDKAADKIADEAVETTVETVAENTAEKAAEAAAKA